MNYNDTYFSIIKVYTSNTIAQCTLNWVIYLTAAEHTKNIYFYGQF